MPKVRELNVAYPTDKPDYDQRTLECERCEHAELSMIVKFK